MTSRGSSRATPFPDRAHVALYGPAGAGKTSIAVHLLNNEYCGSSLYLLTEDPANLERLECEDVDVVTVNDFKELLFTLIKLHDKYELIVIDSVSHVLRPLHPTLASKVAMTVSWLMRKGSFFGLRLSIHQVSYEDEMSYENFVRPWVDCVGEVEKRGAFRYLELSCNGKTETLCFEVVRGGVAWANC